MPALCLNILCCNIPLLFAFFYSLPFLSSHLWFIPPLPLTSHLSDMEWSRPSHILNFLERHGHTGDNLTCWHAGVCMHLHFCHLLEVRQNGWHALLCLHTPFSCILLWQTSPFLPPPLLSFCISICIDINVPCGCCLETNRRQDDSVIV